MRVRREWCWGEHTARRALGECAARMIRLHGAGTRLLVLRLLAAEGRVGGELVIARQVLRHHLDEGGHVIAEGEEGGLQPPQKLGRVQRLKLLARHVLHLAPAAHPARGVALARERRAAREHVLQRRL